MLCLVNLIHTENNVCQVLHARRLECLAERSRARKPQKPTELFLYFMVHFIFSDIRAVTIFSSNFQQTDYSLTLLIQKWVSYLKKTTEGELFLMWRKHPAGLQYELMTFWWSKFTQRSP